MNMAVRSSAFGCACEAPRRRRDVGVDYRDGTSHDDSRPLTSRLFSAVIAFANVQCHDSRHWVR